MSQDVVKVSSRQIYQLWRNIAFPLLIVIFMIHITKLLPPFCAPVVAMIACGVLYFMVYNHTYADGDTCAFAPYTIFLIILTYTFVLIIVNVLHIWDVVKFPLSMIFFEGFYVPALILGPVGCITAMIIYIRRHRLAICNECRLHNGTALERGRAGAIFAHESELQMKNMIFIFGLIGVLAWIYYYMAFSEISYSDRDSFVFKWTTTIILLTDIVYFGIRYYNLYLDLKESGELVTPAEIKHQPANTRVRFYVICDDSIYLARESNAERTDEGLGQVYDTPFRSSRPGKDIDEGTVKQMAAKETDITNGYLKFFFSRRMSPGSENRVNRYFYFLPGEISDYPELAKKGEWLSSEKFKTIFNTRPLTLSPLFLSDMNRLATIMVTSKTFNESGERRTKLMQYRPSFSFAELPGSKVDFHGETWMRVSIYNSDRRWFRLNRWINKHFRSRSQSQDYYHDSI